MKCPLLFILVCELVSHAIAQGSSQRCRWLCPIFRKRTQPVPQLPATRIPKSAQPPKIITKSPEPPRRRWSGTLSRREKRIAWEQAILQATREAMLRAARESDAKDRVRY